ncbi:MAG: SusD/RagB family nutrient-binding outer membrane lipoprotein, partial [Bacteroidales bacterium]
RRLPFTQSEYSSNLPEVTKAISLLKGADNGGTRLWWDVEKSNF